VGLHPFALLTLTPSGLYRATPVLRRCAGAMQRF
jgi:hypothetical protein